MKFRRSATIQQLSSSRRHAFPHKAQLIGRPSCMVRLPVAKRKGNTSQLCATEGTVHRSTATSDIQEKRQKVLPRPQRAVKNQHEWLHLMILIRLPPTPTPIVLPPYLFGFGRAANLSTGTLFWLEVELSEVSYLALQEMTRGPETSSPPSKQFMGWLNRGCSLASALAHKTVGTLHT